jgi:glycosyltransferase-like protein
VTRGRGARVALVTYSSKPRGGAVHTLNLAEALHRQGADVHVFALGDPDQGFFRPVRVPHTLVPAPQERPTLTERVFASVDRLEEALAARADAFDVLHTQDCISARAAARVRDAGADVHVVRTVHHVDDFTTEALVHCQRQAVVEPDTVLVVSRQWRDILRAEYGVDAHVVGNGVDMARFAPVPAARRAALRDRVAAGERFVFLAVGGVEPRKGSAHLFAALAALRGRGDGPPPMLVVLGGHSFQDYADYRREALAALPELGLVLGRDVVLLGSVEDDELPAWYRAADALAFPSVKEGFGLAVLEALAADLPVVASDLPVFREYLHDGVDALLPPVADPGALADALHRVMVDADLRARLRTAGRAVAQAYTWEESARTHRALYETVTRSRTAPRSCGTAPAP